MKNLKLLVYPLITLLSLAAAAAVHAESPSHDNTATQAWAQTKTRAQVQAELMQARADGYAAAWYGEDSGSFTLARVMPQRDATRALASVK